MKFIKNAVHVEKYTDKRTGEEKKKYTTVGALFERNDGSLCMKMLDSWINFYDPKPSNTQKQDMFNEAKEAVQDVGSGGYDDFSDEIPFMRYIDADGF